MTRTADHVQSIFSIDRNLSLAMAISRGAGAIHTLPSDVSFEISVFAPTNVRAPSVTWFDTQAFTPRKQPSPTLTSPANVTCDEIQTWSPITVLSPTWLPDQIVTLSPITTSRLKICPSRMKHF